MRCALLLPLKRRGDELHLRFGLEKRRSHPCLSHEADRLGAEDARRRCLGERRRDEAWRVRRLCGRWGRRGGARDRLRGQQRGLRGARWRRVVVGFLRRVLLGLLRGLALHPVEDACKPPFGDGFLDGQDVLDGEQDRERVPRGCALRLGAGVLVVDVGERGAQLVVPDAEERQVEQVLVRGVLLRVFDEVFPRLREVPRRDHGARHLEVPQTRQAHDLLDHLIVDAGGVLLDHRLELPDVLGRLLPLEERGQLLSRDERLEHELGERLDGHLDALLEPDGPRGDGVLALLAGGERALHGDDQVVAPAVAALGDAHVAVVGVADRRENPDQVVEVERHDVVVDRVALLLGADVRLVQEDRKRVVLERRLPDLLLDLLHACRAVEHVPNDVERLPFRGRASGRRVCLHELGHGMIELLGAARLEPFGVVNHDGRVVSGIALEPLRDRFADARVRNRLAEHRVDQRALPGARCPGDEHVGAPQLLADAVVFLVHNLADLEHVFFEVLGVDNILVDADKTR